MSALARAAVIRLVAGLGLIATIALASASASDGGDRVAVSAGGYIVLALVGAGVLVALLFWLLIGSQLATQTPMRRSSRLLLLGVITALLLAMAAIFFSPTPLEHFPGAGGFGCFQPRSYFELRGWDYEKICGPGHASGGGVGKGGAGGSGGNATVALALALGASTLIVLVAGALVSIAIIRRRRRVPLAENIDGAVVTLLNESLDDLRGQRDVRKAIVACYSRMERVLARSGTPRQPHEAPLEFLARVLKRVAPEPGRALTELFEQARFSAEPMGASEKEQAIAALEALRAKLS